METDWITFWRKLCDMAYYRKDICEKLIALPKEGGNTRKIHFNTVWKEYSRVGDAKKVPELKELYVPRDIFVCAGIWSFMTYCFPNCRIVFWE